MLTVTTVGGTPGETSPYISSVSGDLDASGSLIFDADAAGDTANAGTSWSSSGNNFTIDASADVSVTSTGWGAVGGGLRNTGGGQALAMTFNLSSLTLGAGQSLILDSFTTDVSVTGLEYFVDGVSVASLNPDGGSGTTYTVNSLITDGQLLAWTANGASAAYKVSSMTFSVVPEPSSTALLGLGGLALILRRRL
jgi:hypothetical protein